MSWYLTINNIFVYIQVELFILLHINIFMSCMIIENNRFMKP